MMRMEPDGSRWTHQHAETIENDLNLKLNSFVFLNNFEAIGCWLAAQIDPQANELCQSTKTFVLHQASSEDATNTQTPVVYFGACYLSPDGSDRYQVYPSVPGMTDTFSPRSDEEWSLLKYLRRTQSFVEVE